MTASVDIAYLSGIEALTRFKAGDLSPVDLLDAVIARAEATEPAANAIADRFYDRARDAAKAAEARYRAGAPAGPLDGLPLAVKEADKLAGTRRPNGSLLHTDRIDRESAPVVQRLLDAGAIPHMKTTVPEFCILGATHSRLYGVTRNPWNPAFGPGGSSGGSGVVLATGGTTLATGSDIGGSIRIPASACGVVGYKAPYGRNPSPRGSNLDTYGHYGVMARTVGDAALMQNVVSGRHPEDIATVAEKVVVPTVAPESLKGRRIAYSIDLGAYEVDEGVRRATLDALTVMRDLGATLEEVDLGWSTDIIRAAEMHFAHGWGNTMAANLDRDRSLMTDYAIDYVETALKATVADFHASRRIEIAMYATFGPLMERFDAFVCPTLSVPSVPAEFVPGRTPIEVNGRSRMVTDDEWGMTSPFNTLSRCPVLAVPSGFHPNGVPTGIQIVGRTFDDGSVFEVGLAFEAAAPWLQPGRRPLV
ncbi:amidase [Chthonobacter rhizosphaerae]|uniref:amidase n=1 Tax=Chthonobacter rhizosphaerae TaxID=2735553 RepID=UPI0015EEAD98|nr:amidase [Chthonobacter rhizosphaerae]